ncbi:hypothetical protein B0T18DRAFT_402592 [Schizothecium vesticola]|uniref:Uncharacterized protein n=1 Tax=Schizothecium vesticola TaxID=314040 RepID=A0AA40KAB2_9PEZI|nr:hypothetical protein B0T18DRAFT_402592 [Schizothecium vesticola]
MRWNTWEPDGGRRIPRRILQVPKDQQPLLERDDSWHPMRSGNIPVPEAILSSAEEAYLESKAPRPPTVPNPQLVHPPATTSQNRKRSTPPDFDEEDPVGDRRVTRQVLQVPKDQQPLLERDDSWHSARSGSGNVPEPEAVLSSAKEAYLESNAPRRKQKPQPQASPPPPTIPSPQLVHPSATASQIRKRSAPPDFDEEDSGERQVSWSPSPSRHLRPDSSPDAVPMEGVETLPAQRLPLSRSPSRSLRRRIPQPVPPPSSSQVSDELEIEVPLAITHVPEAAPPKKSLRPLSPTPPSAQIIPSTLKGIASSARPETKRFRRMVDISSRFSPPLAELATPVPPTSTAGGMTATATSPAFSQLDSSNFAPPSPSPIPLRHVIKDPARSLQNSSASDRPPPNGPPSQVPFVAFRTAYPEFSATLNDFLRAVLSVQSLQQQSRLPEFLYDDYIRVFCQDYMDYVKGHDPTTQPLPIFKYYNENVSIPEYTERIILRANLSDVLDCYPTEVAALRSGVRGSIQKEPAASNNRRSFSYRDSSTSRKRSIETVNPPSLAVEVAKPPVQSAEVVKPAIHTAELAFDPIEVAEATQPQPPRKPFSRSTSINSLSNRSFSAAAVPAPEKTLARRVSPVREAPTSILPSIEAPRPSSATPRPPIPTKRPAVAISPMETQPRMASPVLGHDRRKSSPMASATTSIQASPLPSRLAPSTAGTHAAETIPETVARPKFSSRPSHGGVPSSTAKSTKSRKSAAALMDPAERDRRWRKHLESRRQSSAPGGSAGAAPA